MGQWDITGKHYNEKVNRFEYACITGIDVSYFCR